MTQLFATGGLGKAFRVSTDAASYQRFLMRQNDEERLRRDRKAELRNDDAETFEFAMASIALAEIDAFKAELDVYDTATISALQENDIALTRVRARLDPLLDKAHVLPDGRRVFKTEDGLRVFDEHGQEMAAEAIDPDEIADYRPRWEEAEPTIREHILLLEQRTELLDYQSKLDGARDRLDAGDMTRKEFDALREDLKADMPDAVRAQVPGMETHRTQAASESTPQADELNIDDNMVPTAPVIKASTPSFGG